MSAVFRLVERLEQLALHEHLDEPETLGRLLAERQEMLEELTAADKSTLSATEHGEFRERLSELVERNTLLMELVASRQEETRAALEQLRSGRRATNGYAQALSDGGPPAAARRIG
jgi:hypothetical protein